MHEIRDMEELARKRKVKPAPKRGKLTKTQVKKAVHKHVWTYLGGMARCKCGKYIQPDGRVTSTPTGRRRQKGR